MDRRSPSPGEDTGSDDYETVTRSKNKRNTRKSNDRQQDRAIAKVSSSSSSSNNSKNKPQAQFDPSIAAIKARERARKMQRDPTTVFTLWKPEMGHGDPYTWDEDKILWDPICIEKCETEEGFWNMAPRNVYYSDRAIQLIIAAPVTNDHRGFYVGADLDANGDILKGRKPRGLPALDNDGNIVKFCERILHGELKFDGEKYIYNTPEITRGNSRAAIKGPDPVWQPASREAYLQLHEDSLTAKKLRAKGTSRNGSNSVIEADLPEHAATNNSATLPLRRRSPLVDRSKRSASAAGLTPSDAQRPSKKSQHTPTAVPSRASPILGYAPQAVAEQAQPAQPSLLRHGSQQSDLQDNTSRARLAGLEKDNEQLKKENEEHSELVEAYETELNAADEKFEARKQDHDAVTAGLRSQLEKPQQQQAQLQQEKAALERSYRKLHSIAQAAITTNEQYDAFVEGVDSLPAPVKDYMKSFADQLPRGNEGGSS
ncbi:hypothetical protein DL98DRAFT_587607 [Cadophora sp. DSE1049]|nr:hypothetical protein DL98DRAFT_587607 [Cadophora sp. DSE1049]